MKKLLFILAITIIGQLSFAQTTTPQTEAAKPTGTEKKHHKGHGNKKAMMKELNMTDDQKAKMKEMKEANKAKKEAIINDSKLTEDQKKQQLKDLHKAGAKDMQGVLTDEQKAKMKEMKAKRKGERKGKKGEPAPAVAPQS